MHQPAVIVSSHTQLPSLVGRHVELVGVVSNMKCPGLLGVDVWELEAYRGRTVRATGILRSEVITAKQLADEAGEHGIIQSRGPGTFYHLDQMKYEIIP